MLYFEYFHAKKALFPLTCDGTISQMGFPCTKETRIMKQQKLQDKWRGLVSFVFSTNFSSIFPSPSCILLTHTDIIVFLG